MKNIDASGASPGIAIGKAFVIYPEATEIQARKINRDAVDAELKRFERAQKLTGIQLETLKKKVTSDIGASHAAIFEVHLAIVRDTMFRDEVIRRIRERFINVEAAIMETVHSITVKFNRMEDVYIRERATDIRDVSVRVIRNLSGKGNISPFSNLPAGSIVVSHELTPSETAHIDRRHVVGFVTELGGVTSHASIIARNMNIPAVVGAEGLLDLVNPGDILIVDGLSGRVEINPPPRIVEKYQKERRRWRRMEKRLRKVGDHPAVTMDGRRFIVTANLDNPDEAAHSKTYGAEGVGLLRTEYLFLDREDIPTEEEQVRAYRNVIEGFKDMPVTIRTLDLGGDKITYPAPVHEANPFLGYRAIRLCLGRPDIFRSQLRAILRAGYGHKIQVMLPMVSSLDEVTSTRKMMADCAVELSREKLEHATDYELGVLLEIPAAIEIADILADEVDFFSIGTNDLIQYTLAVDRGNERVAYLYQPTHPSVLRLIKKAIVTAQVHGKRISMCGEMAGDPLFSVLLAGMGLDQFSMSATYIPEIKDILRSIRIIDANRLADRVLKMRSAAAIRRYLVRQMRKMVPDYFAFW